MEILRGRPENFRVISGDDALTLAMIALLDRVDGLGPRVTPLCHLIVAVAERQR
jgi:hypothetical protein